MDSYTHFNGSASKFNYVRNEEVAGGCKVKSIFLAALLLTLPSVELGQALIQIRIDHDIAHYLEMKDFSGAILIAQRGKILASKAYGMANYEFAVPNTTRTRFLIASISKQFTATAVVLLEQRNLLGTRDPIAKFIPDFPLGQKITLHHLLTHSSGITGNMETLPDIQQDIEAFHSLDDLVQMLKNAGPG